MHQLTCNPQRLFTLQIVNNWSTMFAKLSILYFLLRLFPRTARRTLSVFIYTGIALNIVYTVILTLYLGIQCGPRPDGHGQFPASCGGPVRDEVGWASAALGIFLDLYVLAISIPTVANLQMSVKRKVGVILVLGTGLLYVELFLISPKKYFLPGAPSIFRTNLLLRQSLPLLHPNPLLPRHRLLLHRPLLEPNPPNRTGHVRASHRHHHRVPARPARPLVAPPDQILRLLPPPDVPLLGLHVQSPEEHRVSEPGQEWRR